MPDSPPIVTITLNPAIDRTLTIEKFAIGKVNRVVAEQSQAAGKGVNVAVMLADLGERVVVSGFLGEDNAEPYETLFTGRGIVDRFVRVDGATRTGLKIVDGTGQTTDINFPGLTPTRAMVGLLGNRIEELVEKDRWFVLSGSVPAGAKPEIFAEVMDRIHAIGGKVVLDTSGAPLIPALARTPAVVKPNREELSELAGHALGTLEEIIRTARRQFIEKGVTLAVVSMGAEGSVFVNAEKALLAVPPTVVVRSTVGAGDAMVAGIVLGLKRGWPLEKIATLASSLGTYAVTRVGIGLESSEVYRQFEPTLKSITAA